MLNLTNANDLDYFNESPYATWSILAERLNYETLLATPDYKTADISLLISVKVLVICPLMLFVIFLFRQANYQILTLLTPFAFIEFLHIKYEKVPIAYEYYLIFIILSLICIIIKAPTIKSQRALKTGLAVVVLVQIYTGYYYIKNSPVAEERNFITTLTTRAVDSQQDENKEIANFINGLPDNSKVLMDDAITYQIVAFTNNIKGLTLPYEDNFLSATETPWNYVNYILIATDKNPVKAYTVLNLKYGPVLNPNSNLQKIYETDNWTLYKIL